MVINAKLLEDKLCSVIEESDESFVNPDKAIRKSNPYTQRFVIEYFDNIKAFLKGEIFPPIEVEIQPSSDCNASCGICSGKYALFNGRKTANNLSKGNNMEIVMDKILNAKVEAHKVRRVKFVGSTGDPLMNPKTLDAIELLSQSDVYTTLFTNGIGLIYRLKGRVYAENLTGLNSLQISLDAASERTYSLTKRISDQYNNVLRGIELAKKASEELEVVIRFTATEYNYTEIEDAAKLAKNIGATKLFLRKDYTRQSNPPDLKEQFEAAKSYESENFSVLIDFYDAPLSRSCKAPFFWSTIASDGCLYPCGHTSIDYGWNLGNLLDPKTTFMGILRQQFKDANAISLPNENCHFCPITLQKANNLISYLETNNDSPVLIQALETVYKRQQKQSVK